MHQDRYATKAIRVAQQRRLRRRRTLIASVALAGLLAVGGTVAWMTASTGELVNTFTPAKVGSSVTEDFTNNVKSKVAVKNDSDIPVYVRATLVVNWVDKSGAVAATDPIQGVDYEIALTTDQGWDTSSSDGYYYYTQPVAAGGSTGYLVGESGLKPLVVKDGYTLKVDVVASVIQANPTDAVVQSWGVTLGADGKSISK